jgi:hypothetical protein
VSADSDDRKPGVKEPYEKPRLRKIELLTEEVLGVGCKVFAGDGSGVAGGGCTAACLLKTGS